MKYKVQSRLASGLTVTAGTWLLLSTRFISMDGDALANIVVAGSIIMMAGLIQLFWENTIPSWITGFVAMWLFIASLAFTSSTSAAWNEAISALICLCLATWDGIEIEQLHCKRSVGA